MLVRRPSLMFRRGVDRLRSRRRRSPPRGVTRPDSYANTTSWARSRACSLVMARLTWVFAVSRADHHLGGDLVVRQPAGHQRRHLALAVGEQFPGRRRAPVRAAADVLADQAAGDRGREQRVAARRRPARPAAGRRARCPSPGSRSRPPGARRRRTRRGRSWSGSRRGRRAGRVGGDPSGRLDAVHHRHLHVDQRDVGPVLRASATACSPSAASATTSMSSSASSRARKPGPHQCLVVGEQHPDHRPSSRQRSVVTVTGTYGETAASSARVPVGAACRRGP